MKTNPGRHLIVLSAALLALWVGAVHAEQALKVPDDVELIRNVEFGTGGDKKLALHILRPKTVPKDPMPALVYINGSAWMHDYKDMAIGRMITAAQRGYFGVTIQIRTSGEALFPAQLEDAKCAIRFLRAKAQDYHIDAERIGVWGESSGGHITALVGLTGDVKELEGTGGWPEFSSRVQAACPMCPAIDFLAPDWPEKHNAPNGPSFRLLGGDPRKDKDKEALARKASPLTYVSKNCPPFYIVHGDADTTVPYSQGMLLLNALKKAGADATFYTIKGGNHGSVHRYDKTVLDEFFDKRLKPGKPAEK
jgi:acetyl esterase/lipase